VPLTDYGHLSGRGTTPTAHNCDMQRSEPDPPAEQQSDFSAEPIHRENDPAILSVPPAVIGFLLLLVVVLACTFYIAAQIVQTP
jgi:hypothetical protein